MNKKVKRIIVAGILLIIDWYIYHDSTSNIYAQALVYLLPYLIVLGKVSSSPASSARAPPSGQVKTAHE